jgi:hypothetical protein
MCQTAGSWRWKQLVETCWVFDDFCKYYMAMGATFTDKYNEFTS